MPKNFSQGAGFDSLRDALASRNSEEIKTLLKTFKFKNQSHAEG